MSVKRVLITGANGFIGEHLGRRLTESGKEVTACVRDGVTDTALTGGRGPVRICRIPSLAVCGELSAIMNQVDAVVHLAGRAHVMHETSADPLAEFRKVNVDATGALALMASQGGVRRFIYVSSVKVNGEATDGVPFYADDPPGYLEPYGQSKWEGEERLRQIAEEGHMEWVVVRPPLVYGPRVRGNFLALLRHIRRGIPSPVGSLHNSRSLVSVFNLCDFIAMLLDHPCAANNRFLVADSEDISTPDLIRHVATAMHRSPRIVPCHEAFLRVAGAMLAKKAAVRRLTASLVVDRQKGANLLGWNAPTTLDWGLNRTAEWFLQAHHGD